MRRSMIDPEPRYACHACGNCCTRPWRVVVEDEKIEAIQGFDWGAKYPHLAGKAVIRTDEVTGKTQHVLAKDDRGACVFFNHDTGKCVLHGELGFDAKPHICRQYPFGVCRAPDGDRVFVHFSCSSVQDDEGPTLIEQQDEIRKLVKPTKGWNRNDVPFSQDRTISIESCILLGQRMADLFDGQDREDMWQRFAQAIQLVVAVGRSDDDQLEDALRDPDFGTDTPNLELTGYQSLRQAPLTPRILLGMNLWTDLFPTHSLGKKVGVSRRISMIMKLMQVVQMRGVYASRLLHINIALSKLGSGGIVAPLPAQSGDLLRRWIRSRLVARSFAIDDLSILAATHVLILDFNAVMFMAQALAVDTEAPPTHAMFKEALTQVGSHITAQPRRFHIVFPAWTLSSLESPSAAWSSLRLLHPAAPAEAESQPQRAQASQA